MMMKLRTVTIEQTHATARINQKARKEKKTKTEENFKQKSISDFE